MSDNNINIIINDEPLQIIGEIITSDTKIEANVITGPIEIEAIVSSGAKGRDGEKGDPFRFEDFTEEQLASISADRHYIHKQEAPSKEWYMYHPLNKFPAVSITDSAGTEWVGMLEYVNSELVIARFSAEFSGKAYLN